MSGGIIDDSHDAEDEGVPVTPKRRVWNFVGAGVTVTEAGGKTIITITSGGGGEANDGANVGTGAGWFKNKVAVDLIFKSIIGETNKIVITDNTDDITVTVGNLIAVLDAAKK